MYDGLGLMVTEINGLKGSTDVSTFWEFLLRNSRGLDGDCSIQVGKL